VHRLSATPALFTFAWRSEQIAADHPLRRLLAELRGSANAVHLTLQRFGSDDVRALIDASDGVPAGLAGSTGSLSDRLFRETEGLPLFVVEYLHALHTDEREPSPRADGEWRVPAGVRELLRSRLAPLSDAARQVLAAAAVIGRSFALDTVTHASGRSEEEAVAALEELVEAGIVRELGYQPASTLPTYDFHHDKLRHIVYEEASLGRRRLLHGRVADSLTRSREAGRGDVAIGLAARHLRLAGREAEAAERFVAAGERARRLSAHAEALGHLRAALALGYPDTGRVRESVGDLYTLRGEYLEAVAAYQTAAAQTEAPATLARLEHKLGLVHERRGNWEAADAHFAAGLEVLPEDAEHAPLRVRLYADRSLTAHRQERSVEARALASTALDLAEATGDAAVLAQAHNVLGMLARTDGDLERAFLHLRRSHDLAQDLDDQGAQVAALNNLALAWVDQGNLPQALEIAKTALALGRSHGDRHREAALLNNVADLLHRAGQGEEAMVYLKEAVAIFTEVGEERVHEPEIWKLVEW
jgi:tetratricopeptide (TPR) repeat protein